MFGEYDSESPRVPSPWDPFLPSPPSDGESCKPLHGGIPKLVPEVEEGNVEYKLKLSHLNPARFARLVTQLKWRLLEGGGQAYYELGVADSGALIGLPRADLEHSLETLEMMAGEIGASVAVVKEIEVPPMMVAIADKLSGYIDPDTGEWAEKMYSRRSRLLHTSDGEVDTTPTTTEPETDFEDGPSTSALVTPADSSRVSPRPMSRILAHRHLTSNPEIPSTQASPSILPLDDDLALFSMEPEPPMRETDDALDEPSDPDPVQISVGIEIASVYKPRPMRKRQEPSPSGPPPNHGKRSQRTKEKKPLPWRTILGSDASGNSLDDDACSLDKQAAKALNKRTARDKRREEKRRTLLASVAQAKASPAEGSMPLHECPRPRIEPAADMVEKLEECAQEGDGLVSGIEALHVTEVASEPVDIQVGGDTLHVGRGKGPELSTTQGDASSPTTTIVGSQGPIAREPRLIVEALVVRKMSIEEAFLDFGGFSLN